MGLDTYATRNRAELTDEDIAAFGAADINLIGGLLSGNGNDGSFRGKVYSWLIEEITGETLYQEWIAPDVVAQMADALGNYDVDSSDLESEDAESLVNLCRFFRVCADRGLGLHGWW